MNHKRFFAALISGLIIGAATLSVAPEQFANAANTPIKSATAPVLPKPDVDQAQAAMWAYRFLTRWHYKRMPLDDAMSGRILDSYLKSLDGERLFFTAADISSFNQYRNTLDDAIYDLDLKAPFDIYSVYRKRINERSTHARALLTKPFDFTLLESLEVDREKSPWANDTKELDDLWRKRVKNDYLRLKLAGKKADEIVKTLDKRYRLFDQRIGEFDSQDVFQAFLNSYATSIEPHTGYLAPRTAENFNITMSLSLQGIGAVLGRDDEYTLVSSVVKGGPASKQTKLKAGDRIVGVAQGKDGPMLDVIGWRVDDVVEKVRGAKGSIVRLDILPKDMGADSKPVLMSIVRDEVKLEDQAASKSIIDVGVAPAVRKIGVISLPSFYHDFEAHRRGDANYRSSTRDVEKLILELKQQKVAGIVIDLRGNGGGSLSEATSLTGLFIDQGPVVQVKNADGRVEIETDKDARIAWDGPLAVLVNRESASASEIFAAALQDYGRAIVVGETTFGKGTVQNLVDLDEYARNQKAQYGQVKLTMAQFFRINGGSTQHKGVVPDVAFPNTWDPKKYGESAYENALPWTQISPASFNMAGNFRDLIPMLDMRSDMRVAKNKEYQYWIEDLDQYHKLSAKPTVSLLETERRKERDEQDARRKKRDAERIALGQVDIKKPEKAVSDLDDGLQADERGVAADDEKKDEKPDVLLSETSYILNDAIDLLGKDRSLAAKVRAFTLVAPIKSIN